MVRSGLSKSVCLKRAEAHLPPERHPQACGGGHCPGLQNWREVRKRLLSAGLCKLVFLLCSSDLSVVVWCIQRCLLALCCLSLPPSIFLLT